MHILTVKYYDLKTVNNGPTGTLLVEGAANSRRVFSAMFIKLCDAGMASFFAERVSAEGLLVA
jgi:hypothetical protein